MKSQNKGSYQQARWQEPFIMEKGTAGERGVFVSRPEPEVEASTDS